MAEITIDGVRLTVPDGQNVLQSALDAGIYIPHLCHHKDLAENGSCRMCIVEVEGQEEVVPSCMLKPEDGMVIHTKTERVNKLRMLALELLLAAHPEDCSTCPKYGNCELQTLIQYVGANNARVRTRNKGAVAEERNPLLIHDMNRCVLCGRCVRACRGLRSVGILDYTKKDLEVYVATLHGKLLKEEDCRFCGACAEVCPTGSIRDRIQAAESGKTREELLVPCRAACPAHTDVPRYIRFVKQGDFDAATAVIREKVPFPTALGYVCNHECEMNCRRGEVNSPMSIRNIKRYASEHDTGRYWKGKGRQLPDTGRKVCVIGGGPAGLTAAYYLRKQGHTVTVKEALPKCGGMMQYGIPAYRLPRHLLDGEIDVIRQQGVNIETGVKVEDPQKLLQDYDAVLLTIGSHQGVRLPMEGSDLPGVLLNIDFLQNCAMEQDTGIGKRVIVLGGGNVAFDCARSAKRLGAEEVHLACLEAREAMTADEEEILQAQEEGVQIYPARTFERITGSDRVTGVDFMQVRSFSFDENHRAVIEKEEGSEQHIAADTVIFATGQHPAGTDQFGLELGRAGSIAVAEDTGASSVEGIFAAGDVVYGTKSVIKAIAAGRDAASAIDRYLGGDGDISETLAPEQIRDPHIGKMEHFGDLERKQPRIRACAERADNFDQVDFGICDGDICGETERCLQCDLRLDIAPPRLWNEFTERKEVQANE